MSSTRAQFAAICVLISAIIGSTFFDSTTHASAPPKKMPEQSAKVLDAYGKLPLTFEINQGQTSPDVKFLSRGQGYGLFLTQSEAVLALTRVASGAESQAQAAMVRMSLVGAKTKPTIVGLDLLQGKSHYFIGNDPSKWHANVGHYGKVKYESVYPGIDLVYYGNQQQLEYDLVVAPGADPEKIRLAFRGVKTLSINDDGQLVLDIGDGELIQDKPVVYQNVNGERKLLDGKYVLKGKLQVGFQLAKYDRSKPLVIDPVLAYSTFLGATPCSPSGICSSSGESGLGIVVDGDGNAYVTGRTYGFPTTSGAYDQECGGPELTGSQGGWSGLCMNWVGSSDGPGVWSWASDAFVAKLNASGTALLYSTYLGGWRNDAGQGIALDSTGHVYVTGYTNSDNFPTTSGAYDTSCACNQYSITDVFVSKLTPDGTIQPATTQLAYSTLLGGSATDTGYSIAVDSEGKAYITGTTNSVDFPASSGSAQPLIGGGTDAFVTKVNSAGTAIEYSTFVGGSGNDNGYDIAISVAEDLSVNAHVTGSTGSTNFPLQGAYQSVFGGVMDAFVTKLNSSGTAFSYSSYLGGNGDDRGYGIALDSLANGWNVYVTGSTASTNFPTTSGAFTGAYVTKLDLDAGNQLVYSTNPGGSSGYAIAVTGAGGAYVAGANGNDGFVTQLDIPGTSQVYAYSLGGSGVDVAHGLAVDSSGNAYVTGATASTDMPVTPNAIKQAFGGSPTETFVSKIATGSAVRFSATTSSVSESAGTITLTVERIGSSVGVVSVDFATSNGSAEAGSDYTASTGTVSFNDGVTTPQSIVVPITNDTAEELNETFTVTLSNPAGGYLNNPGTATVTITNDDTWARLQFSTASYFSGESDGFKTITVTRTGPSTGAVSANYATGNGTAIGGTGMVCADGEDYLTRSGTVTFGDGETTPQTFTVPICGDSLIEGPVDETVTLTLSNPSGPAFLGTPSTATWSINDNDEALQFSLPSYSVGEGAGSATITVTRTGLISSFSVTVDYATSDGSAQAGSDYTAASGTLSFGPGISSQQFSVPILSDSAGEPYETVTLTLSNVTGGSAIHGVTILPPNPVTLTIVDDDVSDQPTISNIASGNITSNSARITWSTSLQTSDSDVEYGTSTAYGAHAYLSVLTNYHSVDLTGLAYSTTYHYRVKSRNGSGQLAVSEDQTFTTTSLPLPTVTSLNLPSVTYGVTANSSVTIYGTNFVVGATITVGGLTGTTVSGSSATAGVPYVYVTSSQLKFWWPNTSLAPGAYSVEVTNPDTASATLTNGFTVVAPQPTIGSMAANTVTHGVTSSQQVNIYGTNFVVGATITVGGLTGTTVSGSSATAGVPYVYVTSSQLKFWWPNTSLEPGAYTVQVTNPAAGGGLSATLTDGFTVAEPVPAISSVAANNVTFGVSSSNQVTINGTNFALGATITVGDLTGTTVSGSSATAGVPYVYVNSSQLKFWWPNTSLAPGAYTVQVVNPTAGGGHGVNLINGFTVVAPQPTISSVTANSVTYGVTNSSQVTIYGTNFVLGATVTVGSLSGTTVSGSSATAGVPYVYVTNGQLKFWWPNTALAPGAYAVTVTNPGAAGGLGASLTNGFTVVAPQPTITFVSASSVTYGVTANQQVTISGTNFVVGSTITVGTLSGATVSGSSATAGVPYVLSTSGQVKFWWPNTSLAPGAYTVTVTNPAAAGGLSASLANGFTVVAPQPTIVSVAMSPVVYGSTTSRSITISGTNFVLGSTITVGSLSGNTVSGSNATVSVPYVFTTSGQVKFWWPNTSLPADSYDVTVTNPAAAGGNTTTLTDGFVVQ